MPKKKLPAVIAWTEGCATFMFVCLYAYEWGASLLARLSTLGSKSFKWLLK